MAYVSLASVLVLGGVAGESMQEGRAVTMTASGLHNDLPTVLLAASGAVDVWVVMATPDQFARPTLSTLFGYPSSATFSRPSTITPDQNFIESRTFYNIGPSMLGNPTLASGWKVQLHRGGIYAVPSGAYVANASLANAGAGIKVDVGGAGKWAYCTASDSARVGTVREYRTDGTLLFHLGMRVV